MTPKEPSADLRLLCPERAMRDAMTDDEFWAHVADGLSPEQPDEYNPDHDALDAGLTAEPCPECGATGACGWDDEGRPMLHAIPDDDS